jgi:hypothetical protein
MLLKHKEPSQRIDRSGEIIRCGLKSGDHSNPAKVIRFPITVMYSSFTKYEYVWIVTVPRGVIKDDPGVAAIPPTK